MKRRRRRNPPAATRRVLNGIHQQAIDAELEYVVVVVEAYTIRHGDAGEYLARAAEQAWELDDQIFSDPHDAEAAYVLLANAAVELGGDPRYARQRNPAANRREYDAREAVREHAADRRWTQRIPGGTKRAPASFDRQALLRGTVTELEHTTDPMVAIEIAMDHLDEDPHYYCTSCRTPRGNPDPAACALGKWAWDRDPGPCGRDSPTPSQAGRDLAKKRWTLPERERRVAARLLI